MTLKQLDRYTDRIDKAIRRIETGIETDAIPDLGELADAAGMSEYHFHRIFRLLTGETAAQAVKRARLSRSLPALSDGIMEATARSGYGSSQAYARALRAAIDLTPSQLRSDAELRENASRFFAEPKAETGPKDNPMRISITSVEPLQLAIVHKVGDYSQLNSGFEQVFDEVINDSGEDAIGGLYGIPYDDPRSTDAERCRFDCAVSLTEHGDKTFRGARRTIEGGRALRLRHEGDYDRIHGVFDELYVEVMVSDHSISKRPVLVNYLDDPDTTPTDRLRADIFLFLEA